MLLTGCRALIGSARRPCFQLAHAAVPPPVCLRPQTRALSGHRRNEEGVVEGKASFLFNSGTAPLSVASGTSGGTEDMLVTFRLLGLDMGLPPITRGGVAGIVGDRPLAIPPFTVPVPAAVEDPRSTETIPEVRDPGHGGNDVAKEAHRMLRIRKKKMKVHRRRRLWKRMWSIWKKKFARRERDREVAFRKRLMAKVQAAQVFDAGRFVEDYLEDYRFQFTPKTYKGRRKPQWLIRELLERDRRAEVRSEMDRTDLVTDKPLIQPGDTVERFIERNWTNKS